ncbi:MAG: iron-containing alcohol dehydrogenase [Parvibaculales bacterium]
MMGFDFATVKNIHFGRDSIRQIDDLLSAQFSGKKVFIVTDAGLMAAGIVPPVVAQLESQFQVKIYQDVQADPSEQIIVDALEQAKVFDADIIIGFGGGSSMDTAKLIAVLLDNELSLPEIYGVEQIFTKRKVPLVLIPTTAGTGSEVTPISIVTTGETTKMGVVSKQLYADIAILDPILTLDLPPHITAATGIDAMVHAIEAYTSQHKKNPLSDMCAKQALHLLHAGIKAAVDDGHNIQARENMLLGAMLAGQAFANAPVAAIHALAYPIGGIFHVSHGLSNALVMLPVMRFNADSAAPLYAELAPIFNPNIVGHDGAMTQALIGSLDELMQELGLERNLSQLGIGEKDLDRMADDAMLQTRLLMNNPKEVKRDDAFKIYQSIL